MTRHAALLLTILGCAGGRATQGPPVREATAPKVTAVRLLSAGQSPLVRLRFHPSVNQHRSVLMTVNTQMRIALDGEELPNRPIPEQRFVMDTWASEVLPNGDARSEVNFTSVEVQRASEPTPTEGELQADAMVRGMTGLSGNSLIDSRGFSRGSELRYPPDINPALEKKLGELKQTLQNISMVLPEEPVGVGAQWKTATQLSPPDGISTEQLTTYTVTEIRGDEIQLSIQVEQRAAPQTVRTTATPEGAQMRLLTLSSVGEGTATVRLAQLIPIHSELHLSSLSNFIIAAEGKSKEMTLSLEFGMHVQDAPLATSR